MSNFLSDTKIRETWVLVESCYRSHLKGNGSGTWNTETIIERPNGMERTKFIVCMTVLISTSSCYPPYFYKDYWQSRLHENLPSPSDQRWCRLGADLGKSLAEQGESLSRANYALNIWLDYGYEVVQSRRRPLLGPSPGWKRLLPQDTIHY